MSQLQDRIAQFRKMANDDPDNELGHYRLGQLLMEAGQYDEAAQSFRRTLELSPQFSKVYQLLAQSLLQLGEAAPAPTKAAAPAAAGDGFRCRRPGCFAGTRARRLPAPPIGVDRPTAEKIVATVCADCWNDWLRNMSIKVINELRLDLSTERGAEEYDRYMREYLGLE